MNRKMYPLILAIFATLAFAGCSSSEEEDETGEEPVTDLADPFYKYAWHLKNTGQRVFAPVWGIEGKDLKFSSANQKTYTGKNIKVLISDDGLESEHEDLKDNFSLNTSKDFHLPFFPYNSARAEPKNESDNHGTSVAGLVAAQMNNGLGSRGVAPEARLSSANYLSTGVAQSEEKTIDQATGNFDIFNQSWGVPQLVTSKISANYEAQLAYATSNYREGKGALYVKSAGNDYAINISADPSKKELRIGNANFDGHNTVPYVIIVGATNALGVSSSYSSPGSALWISAPGGEYGGVVGSALENDSPAMITTDRSGCSLGYAKVSSSSMVGFERGSSENPNCNYTSGFNGTSSAAPVLTGSIALLLQANPNLTWRDVKHILASTATQPNLPSVIKHPQRGTFPSPDTPTLHEWELGWQTNKAGYKFQNWYGFGVVDLDAALNMAKSYALVLGEQRQTRSSDLEWYYSSGPLAQNIPDFDAAGATHDIDVKHNFRIEAVQIKVDITHPNAGSLGVELTSPEGTKSILMNINNSLDGQADLDNITLLSNAFYGESSKGTWTVKVIDGRENQTGTLDRWDINIVGHIHPDPDNTDAPNPPTALVLGPELTDNTMSPTFEFTNSDSTDILRYEYSIGTTAGGSDVREWTPLLTTSPYQASDLSLSLVTDYYINVRSIDTAENISATILSSSAWRVGE